ncbi:hypothetical protein VFPBJ_11530 [Purpureocillium lilacinum]|uniref:Uncharacterized protein n=1 Tax=Purpureocillium lilacinum TaxID=33203 RepID=A0A179F645_PURLI|nr:hypothetical protein VFPBJ_11530 [Purpureocillium lilacinum]
MAGSLRVRVVSPKARHYDSLLVENLRFRELFSAIRNSEEDGAQEILRRLRLRGPLAVLDDLRLTDYPVPKRIPGQAKPEPRLLGRDGRDNRDRPRERDDQDCRDSPTYHDGQRMLSRPDRDQSEQRRLEDAIPTKISASRSPHGPLDCIYQSQPEAQRHKKGRYQWKDVVLGGP